MFTAPTQYTTPTSLPEQPVSPEHTPPVLNNLETLCQPALKQLAIREAHTEGIDTTQLHTLLEAIENTPKSDISTQAKTLLNTHLHSNPKLIGLLIKYINAQLMIMNAAENQIAANQITQQSQQHLEHSIRRLSSSEKLQRLKASPVITGHPTHLNKPETVHKLLNQILEVNDTIHLDEFCQNIWEGLGHREERPSVQQEAQHYAPYLAHMIESSHSIQKQVQRTLSKLNQPTHTNPMIEIGSWVAGDRDGNPNITAQTLRDVISHNSQQVFGFYQRKLRDDSNLGKTLNQQGQSHALSRIRNTLKNTEWMLTGNPQYQSNQAVYNNPSDFENDLQTHLKHNGTHDKIERLCTDVRGKGFYGATTDIRQNSAMNEKTVMHLLSKSGVHSNYLSLDEEQRCQVLQHVLNHHTPLHITQHSDSDSLPPAIQNEFELINTYKSIQDKFGDKALKNCITANTENASDMLEVMVLLQHAGLAGPDGLKMNIMPLIETVPDLENASKILDQVIQVPWYKAQLTQTGNTQHVMVGYSDSNRLDGPLPSAWAVHVGIQNMMDTMNAQGIDLHVFHGRGGTEARGSGHSYQQDIAYLDGNSLSEGIRQTEQGEEIPAKFGNRKLSTANLTDMLTSTIQTHARGKDQHIAHYTPVMEALSQTARQTYQTLYNDKDLVPFFKNTTPIEFVKHSNAGSRPASRKKPANNQEFLENMRAIPWAAAWYQSGNMMPAYYGIGSALKQYCEQGVPTGCINPTHLETLKTMYQDWPFFKNLIDRTDLALHKANMPLAKQYAELDPPTQHLFHNIAHEFDTTQHMIEHLKTDDEPRTTSVKEGITARGTLRNWAQTLQIGLLKSLHTAGQGLAAENLQPLLVQTMQANANSIGRFG